MAADGGRSASAVDGERSNSDAVVADDHEGAVGEVCVELLQVGNQQARLGLGASGDLAPEEHDARGRISGVGEKGAEVRVEREEHPVVINGRLKDYRVRRGAQSQVTRVDGVVISVGQQRADRR